MKGRRDMTERRFWGIIIMTLATLIGAYVGVWQLFIQPIMELIRTYNKLEFYMVVYDMTRILIFFPMVMLLAYALFKIGQMIFLDE